MKYVELVCVNGGDKNNNKYYKMQENADGTFTAKWGRVGGHESTKNYPMKDWDKLIRDKTQRKDQPYTDVTAMRADVKTTTFKDLADSDIQKLLKDLEGYAKKSIQENYTVASENVTKAQVDTAQEIVDELSKLVGNGFDYQKVNEFLKKLYITIPRKMKRVQDFLLDSNDKEKADKIIANEQGILDVMSQQVSMNKPQDDTKEISTLEHALGIKIEKVKDDEIKTIKELMGSEVSKFKRAFKVTNLKTQVVFDKQKSKSIKDWTKLLWHGSRNENWLNILQTGLVLRPSNVVITGKMFGYGIYYADKCGKSMGYTSLSGSYWARGNANKAYMALFEVNTGMELRVERHEGWMTSLDEGKLKNKGQYDSLFAKGGYDLRNNEYIIYNQNQNTIKYIVEIGN